jgi:hypothetical protein
MVFEICLIGRVSRLAGCGEGAEYCTEVYIAIVICGGLIIKKVGSQAFT